MQLYDLKGCVIWSPKYRKYATLLDRVQKKFTRILPRLADLSYRERFNRLDTFSLRW